jgi:hypothetical protein
MSLRDRSHPSESACRICHGDDDRIFVKPCSCARAHAACINEIRAAYADPEMCRECGERYATRPAAPDSAEREHFNLVLNATIGATKLAIVVIACVLLFQVSIWSSLFWIFGATAWAAFIEMWAVTGILYAGYSILLCVLCSAYWFGKAEDEADIGQSADARIRKLSDLMATIVGGFLAFLGTMFSNAGYHGGEILGILGGSAALTILFIAISFVLAPLCMLAITAKAIVAAEYTKFVINTQKLTDK